MTSHGTEPPGTRPPGTEPQPPGTEPPGTEPPSTEPPSSGRSDDVGLLSPGRAGSAAEAATGDAAFLRAMLDAEAALTRAQAALGMAPAAAAAAVDAAARADRYDARDLALRARGGGNPVIPLVADLTAATAEIDPGAARYVHRGATSQDIVDTALMLMARRALAAVLHDLRTTAGALARLAAEHRTTAMPGRTLTQHAVPTTFGLKAAGWRALVCDAHDRLAAVRASLPVQLGGAAGTLAAFTAWRDADRAEASGGRAPSGPAARRAVDLLDAYAAELGLAAPAVPWHTLRTPVADLGAALAFTAGALGRLAEDVLVLSRTEIAEVAEGAGGGSSAMPHKSNPVRATLIAAAARRLPPLAATLLGSLAVADERPAGAWHAEWEPLREALRLVGGAARDAADLTGGLRVFPDRMRANLDLTGGAVASERLAALLSVRLGRGPAKDLLSRAARRAAERRIPLADALAAEPDATAAEQGPTGAGGGLPARLPDDLRDRLPELLDPVGYLGSAPELVDRALARRPVPPHPSAPRREESP